MSCYRSVRGEKPGLSEPPSFPEDSERFRLAALADLRRGLWRATESACSKDHSERLRLSDEARSAYDSVIRLLTELPDLIVDPDIEEKLTRFEALLKKI